VLFDLIPRFTHPSRAIALKSMPILALVAVHALLGLSPPASAHQVAVGVGGPFADPLVSATLEQAKLVSPDGAEFDYFGHSVAVSGDTALVGAPHDNYSEVKQGAAYVFVRSAAGWNLQATLTAADQSGGTEADRFGWSVALDGDTALVGAPYMAGVGSLRDGAAYVFTRSEATWNLQAKLIGVADPEFAGAARFGGSVALDGDIAVIGAPEQYVNEYDHPGAAYLFARSGTVWSQKAELIAGDGFDEDAFGYSVAISDGTALVGAPFAANNGVAQQGAAYVFTRSAGWSQQAKLLASDGGFQDDFGTAVALSGDTALVGAPEHEPVRAVYVFARSSTAWSQQAKLTHDYDEGFGASLALSGDTAVIGDPEDEEVHVFDRTGEIWSLQADLLPSDGRRTERFGHSVALSGHTVLVGAPWHYDVDGGAAYVFELGEGSTDTIPPTTTVSGADAAWHNRPVTLTFAATDNSGGSGVAKTEYKLDTGAWTTGTSLTVSAPGSHPVSYRSTDAAGNLETAKSRTVKIDTGKPTTRAYAASVRRGAKVRLAYRVDDPAPSCGRAKVTLKVYQGSRLKKTIAIKSTVACNLKKTHAWQCTLPRGRYTLKVYATDIAGNKQSKVGSNTLTVK